MKKFFLFLLLAAACPLTANDLNPQVQQLINNPVLQNAWWGGAARRANGETLFAVNAEKRMAPASTLKLLTTAAALDEFGPNHRFETRLYADALPDQDGVLTGNIYIRGGGDPTLGSPRVKGSAPGRDVLDAWAKAVQKAGIKRIDGNLYADVSIFEGPSIPIKVNWENIGNYFAAPATALAFNDNSFRIYFAPEPRAGKTARVEKTEPAVENVRIDSFVTTDAVNRKDNAYVYGAPHQFDLRIYGTIPTNLTGFSVNAAMPDAPLFTLQAFQDALYKKGVAVRGKTETLHRAPDYAPMHLLHTQYSPELKDIIYIVNKRSFNFYAEMLLRQLALKAGRPGTVDNGVAALETWLAKNEIATDNLKIYDGSGLSRDNMISANTLTDVLWLMSKHPHFEWYYKSLATPDDRGDLLVLRWFLRPLKKVNQVRLKGGTIDGVKAAAGYVTDQNGELVSFALIANNLLSKDETINRIHENIIKVLLTSAEPSPKK